MIRKKLEKWNRLTTVQKAGVVIVGIGGLGVGGFLVGSVSEAVAGYSDRSIARSMADQIPPDPPLPYDAKSEQEYYRTSELIVEKSEAAVRQYDKVIDHFDNAAALVGYGVPGSLVVIGIGSWVISNGRRDGGDV